MPDDQGYARDAQRQLDLVALADDPGEKRHHLDRAAHFATLHERSRAPHRLVGDGTEDRGIEAE